MNAMTVTNEFGNGRDLPPTSPGVVSYYKEFHRFKSNVIEHKDAVVSTLNENEIARVVFEKAFVHCGMFFLVFLRGCGVSSWGRRPCETSQVATRGYY